MSEPGVPCPFRENTIKLARHVKLKRPSTADDNGKVEMLRKLQESIYFEKDLPPTSVGMEYVLAVPSWFIEKHGDKLGKSVILRSESSTKAWTVNLNLSIGQSPQVRFSGGWRAFVRFNNLAAGDSLIFSLKATSEFEVYVFRRVGTNPTRFPRTRSRTWRGERVAAAGNFEGRATEKVVREGLSVSASGPSATSCNLSSSDSIDLHLLKEENFQYSSTGGHRYSHYGIEPGIELDAAPRCLNLEQHIGETMEKDDGFESQSAPVKTIRSSQLPGFFIKLTASNFCQSASPGKKKTAGFLEIPQGFWKAYSNRLHSVVQMQGIHEESPARSVTCSLTSQHKSGGQYWRLFLRAGWRDFRDENNLELGQALEFSLSANSFFVVRRVETGTTGHL